MDVLQQTHHLQPIRRPARQQVLASTGISDDERKEYSKVLRKFDEFFKVRRNVILERAKFNIQSQMVGESTKQYITALYNLVETCEYKADTVEEMLRDRLVVGIRNATCPLQQRSARGIL